MNPWESAAGLFFGTFVSEDFACIGAGLLIHQGELRWQVGVPACLLGIFVSDLGLWLAGRCAGARILAWPWVQRRFPACRLRQLEASIDSHGWKAILASRFLPGTRLPMYVAAGMLGHRAKHFAFSALLAAALWTPLLVLMVASLGEGVVAPLQRILGTGTVALIAAALVLWTVAQIGMRSATPLGRARLWAKVSRFWRWEFWPSWLFYLPLLPWIAYLAFRHRGLATITAANPGISPHGGIVGESKYAILSKLPPEWIVPSALIESGASVARQQALQSVMASRNWQFPIILKPDAGQRGAGVRLIRDIEDAHKYLDAHPLPLVAQAFHAGPYEAGIFYVRIPGRQRGRIFSITDKQFPVLVGDGASTVESLIWRHPRFRMQAGTFLSRMYGQARLVLAAGETLPLAIAGNHCQGTLFRDGAHLITPALERAVDEIARHFEGFYFGRFDVRYSDVGEFRAGRGFAIVELNGVTSESTNIYDPDWSLLRAYGVLLRQWTLLFEVGERNRKMGHRPSRLGRVIVDARTFYRERTASLPSD